MKQFILNIDNINYKINLGQNARENFQLIDNSSQNYWWFHLNKFSSGHCIIESDKINKELIIFASDLVKQHSKYKNFKNLSIIYTQIKNIKKTQIIGEVQILSKKKLNTIYL